MNTWKQLVTILLSSAVLFGCGSSDSPRPAAGGGAASETEKLYVSMPDQGVVKSIHLKGAAAKGSLEKTFHDHPALPTFAVEATIDMKSSEVPAPRPGEVVFSGGFAYVRLTDSNFVQRFDVATDGRGQNHAMAMGVRPIHLFVDPDDKVWVGNDGPRTSGAVCPGVHGDCLPDTVSVIDKGAGTAHPPIETGSGHHLVAFSRPSPLKEDTPKRAFITNLHDDTLSVIDNDPASPTYLQGILKDALLNGQASLKLGADPHGIAFSPVSGKIYVPDSDPATADALWVIDPNDLAVTKISKGSGTNEIPVVGSPVVRHVHDDPTDGQFIYLMGSLKDTIANTTTGYITVLDTLTGSVKVTTLSGIVPSRIAFTPNGKKAYVGSSRGTAPTPDINDNLVVVLNADPTSSEFNQEIGRVLVGKAAASRPGLLVSGSGEFVFVANAVPAAGGAPAETTLSVINTDTDTVVATIPLDGIPGNMGIVRVEEHGH